MITAIRYAVAMTAGALLGLVALWGAFALAALAAMDTLATFAGIMLAGAR